MCDSYATIFNSEERKARKPHRCCECWQLIPVGAKYEYITGLWEGSWDSFHTCLTCADLRTQVPSDYDCVAYGFLRDAVFDIPESFPRSMLPHPWLMELHDKELDDSPDTAYGVDFDTYKAIIAPLAARQKYYRALSSPKRWRERQEKKIEEAGRETRYLNFLIKKRDSGTLNDYEKEKLTGAFG